MALERVGSLGIPVEVIPPGTQQVTPLGVRLTRKNFFEMSDGTTATVEIPIDPLITNTVLVTACAGGAGGASGRGGNGGTFVFKQRYNVPSTSIIGNKAFLNITRGTGGAASSSTSNNNGGATVIGTLITLAGGSGSSSSYNDANPDPKGLFTVTDQYVYNRDSLWSLGDGTPNSGGWPVVSTGGSGRGTNDRTGWGGRGSLGGGGVGQSSTNDTIHGPSTKNNFAGISIISDKFCAVTNAGVFGGGGGGHSATDQGAGGGGYVLIEWDDPV